MLNSVEFCISLVLYLSRLRKRLGPCDGAGQGCARGLRPGGRPRNLLLKRDRFAHLGPAVGCRFDRLGVARRLTVAPSARGSGLRSPRRLCVRRRIGLKACSEFREFRVRNSSDAPRVEELLEPFRMIGPLKEDREDLDSLARQAEELREFHREAVE